MGGLFSSPSQLVDVEKTSWVRSHKLNCIASLKEEQIELLSNFGSKLQLCYYDRTIYGYEYQHWWVTDGNWIIEFGGGEIQNATVLVHCNPRPMYTTVFKFALTPEGMERMKKVCGTSNYSLALRNCEHVARYIHCGAWLCSQMVGDGVLRGCFFSHMTNFTKRINTFPDEVDQ